MDGSFVAVAAGEPRAVDAARRLLSGECERGLTEDRAAVDALMAETHEQARAAAEAGGAIAREALQKGARISSDTPIPFERLAHDHLAMVARRMARALLVLEQDTACAECFLAPHHASGCTLGGLCDELRMLAKLPPPMPASEWVTFFQADGTPSRIRLEPRRSPSAEDLWAWKRSG